MTKRTKILISLILVSLILRIFLSFQVYSGDLNNHMAWASQILNRGAQNAYYQEYPGVMMPTYPPVSLLNFISSEWLYRQTISSANYLNKSFSLFPSKIIWAMEDSDFRPAFYKILNIVCDIGIGLLIFKITRSNLMSGLFLLNPAVWYLSTLWGQIDYVPIFFILLAYTYTSHLSFVLALLTKQTTIVFTPIFLLLSFKKIGFKKTLLGLLLQVSIFIILYSIFTANPVTTYLDRLNTGSGSIWINDNAFNPWVFVSQMRKIPDTQYRLVSIIIFAFIVITILNKYIKNINLKNAYWSSFLISAAAFFIMTRMHERYFAPALPFLLLLSYKNKKILSVYILASIIHLLNLYHWWWYPNLPQLFLMMSKTSSLYFLSSIFTLLFIYMTYVYIKKPVI